MILTPARAGIARSQATRSGYPVAQGKVLPLFALSNVARSGATRANAHSKIVFLSIGGTYNWHLLYAGASIHDVLNDTPTTANFAALTMNGVHPVEGQDVVITLGSKNNANRLFGGQILATTRGYVGQRPANAEDDLRMIDYTWGLERRQVRTRYLHATVQTIVTDLIATYAPGYTVQVAADIGAEVVDEITFTETTLPGCLTQLVRRVGGSWQCDYRKVVWVFFEDTATTNPSKLNAVHHSLYAFTATRDLSQIVTRVYVEGGGVNSAANCAVGETVLPLDGDIGWYATTGGVVVSGPQRLTYTSVVASGGGGLVGPGAAPSGAVTLTLAAGAGIDTGAHDYAVTFTTASGESIAGPRATIFVGALAPPPPPGVSAPYGANPGIDPGAHSYAVSFVTGTGETTPGPVTAVSTGLLAVPTGAPIPGTPAPATTGGVDQGSHEYAVVFHSPTGYTTPGPIGPPVQLYPPPNPTTVPTVSTQANGAPATGSYSPIGESQRYVYAYSTTQSYVDFSHQTASSPPSATIQTISNNDPLNPAQSAPVRIMVPFSQDPRVKVIFLYQWGSSVPGGQYHLTYQTDNHPEYPPGTQYGFYTQGGGTSNNPNLAPTVSTASALSAVPLTNIPTAPITTLPTISSRLIYRRSGGAGLRLLTEIGDNTTTTYTDTKPNADLQSAPPTTNTATLTAFIVDIPAGSALVTARKLYRTAAGGTQLKFVATLDGAVEGTYGDYSPDSSLGANAPTVNTTTANRVTLTAIPTGAASVTSRKLYRTLAGGTILKVLATLADNTTTTYADSAADSALGATVPAGDTSGLTQPQGIVLPGAATIQMASVAGFPASGWAVIGNGQQVIRYTSLNGNVLTGIPASGPGAITASISFNSTATAAPSLLGIPATGTGSIRFPILKGDEVNLLVQVDDGAAQLALAGLVGGDGIQEAFLQDRRLSQRESTARGEAHLALRRDVLVEARFQTRDINTRAGRTIAINLGPPFNLVTELLIQDVTITFTPTADGVTGQPRLMPLYTATASSIRFTFEDLLRAIRKAA